MLTLSEASLDTKKLLRLGGIILAIIFLIFIAFKIIVIVKDLLIPEKAPKAESKFGKLTVQIFPTISIGSDFKYTINTITGFLPNTEPIAKIYRYQIIKPDLLNLAKFQQKASAARFSKNYTAITDSIFEWKQDTIIPIRTLRANVQTGNFEVTSDYQADKNILAGTNLPDQKRAKIIASSFLTALGSYPKDVDDTKTKIVLYSINNGTLVPSASISTSQIIEVDFFQKDINKIPVIYENPNSSNIRVLIGGGESSYNVGQVVAANFFYQALSEESSTYALKSTNQAFAELSQGKGYVASYFGNSNNISINSVYLAYYISTQPQDFLMPIFVFKGNDNFYAYVPAVRDEWINK